MHSSPRHGRRVAALRRVPALPALFLLLVGHLGAAPAGAAGEAKAELFASGLSTPRFAAAPRGSTRLFVAEAAGRIQVVEADGSVRPTPFLDLSARPDIGVLGLAFPPDYSASPYVYLYYVNAAEESVISRFPVSEDSSSALAASEEVVLAVPQPAPAHRGGTIAFGPEGFLWLAVGDGGSSLVFDPDDHAQDPSTLQGKVIRIDPGPDFAEGSIPVEGVPYRIPADNPFVDDPDTRDEIQAFGLRNPFRFSFDRERGDLWIGDVGEAEREEVDFQSAEALAEARNWGWDVMEGSLCNPNDPAPSPPCNDPSLSLPRYEYPHLEGNCSITGGYVYRHRTDPLEGLYFFGDFCTGRIWTLDPADDTVVDRSSELPEIAASSEELVAFGEGGRGELYAVLHGGEIWRIRPVDPACDDGVDNDGDGRTDLDDPSCRDDPSGDREFRLCGLGFELAPMLLGLLGLRRLVRRRGRARG